MSGIFDKLFGGVMLGEIRNCDKRSEGYTRNMQEASCAILVEMANADQNFAEEERTKIYSLMKKSYRIDDVTITELISHAQNKHPSKENLDNVTSYIRKNFFDDEKYELMKSLWQLVYADESLHENEEKLLKKIGKELDLSWLLIKDAKKEALEELKK